MNEVEIKRFQVVFIDIKDRKHFIFESTLLLLQKQTGSI